MPVYFTRQWGIPWAGKGNIVANVKLYFKLKKYILPQVETEKCSIQEKKNFHLLLADRSIPKDYFQLLLPNFDTEWIKQIR